MKEITDKWKRGTVAFIPVTTLTLPSWTKGNKNEIILGKICFEYEVRAVKEKRKNIK